jgi:hypothetical protein
MMDVDSVNIVSTKEFDQRYLVREAADKPRALQVVEVYTHNAVCF